MTKHQPQPADPPIAVTLQTPIVRGEQRIDRVTLRRPKAGALRGIRLVELMQLDAGSVMTLLPRITEPPLLAHEVENMDPADLITLGGHMSDFLLPRSEQPTPAEPAAQADLPLASPTA